MLVLFLNEVVTFVLHTVLPGPAVSTTRLTAGDGGWRDRETEGGERVGARHKKIAHFKSFSQRHIL